MTSRKRPVEPLAQLAFATDLCAGDYNVTITDAEGCTTIATVTVDVVEGIEELGANGLLRVFPNPAHDQVTIDLERTSNQPVNLVLYNSLGAQVRTMLLTQPQTQLSLGDLPAGIYWLSASDGKQRWNAPLVLD